MPGGGGVISKARRRLGSVITLAKNEAARSKAPSESSPETLTLMFMDDFSPFSMAGGGEAITMDNGRPDEEAEEGLTITALLYFRFNGGV